MRGGLDGHPVGQGKAMDGKVAYLVAYISRPCAYTRGVFFPFAHGVPVPAVTMPLVSVEECLCQGIVLLLC